MARTGLVQTAPPAAEPVTVAEVKAYGRVSGSEEDTLLALLIQAAREHAETYTNRQILTATWAWSHDGVDANAVLELPKSPAQSIVSVTYREPVAGSFIAVDTGVYRLDNSTTPPRIYPKYNEQWPSDIQPVPYNFIVTFQAGWGAFATAVPARLRMAILMLTNHFYEIRQPVMGGLPMVQVPMGIQMLLDEFRVHYA